ncbi:phage tail protein [Kribbella sp. C-35]|uniref:phage tail protein n=1 Tax=Kribbella sp. C-35 TaxID=2789276 RepID=UPI00397CF5DC
MEQSSYLRYLPPALWRDTGPPDGIRLGEWLRIVEKVLTGINDDVRLDHGDHAHDAVADVVAGTDRLFDAWKTPEKFLPYLASWVGLDLPTLRGEPLWDEYQRRRVTASIAAVYRRRGLKGGLLDHLALHTLGPARPRVAIDDGSRVLVTRPRPDLLAPVNVMVSQGPVLRGSTVVTEGLIRPWCIARGGGGDLFVGDVGLPTAVPLPLRPRVWRLTSSGDYTYTGAPPKPRPVAPDTQFRQVVGVAVRPPRGAQPETLYILDVRGTLTAVAAPYDAPTATQVTTLAVGANLFAPVALAVDVNGDLLVLDRGDGPGTPNPPKIVTITPTPLSVTRHALTTVLEPLSLLVRPDATLVIGDGREQEGLGPGLLNGNLVVVDRTNAAAWAESLLLPTANPLVAPTAVTHTRGGALHVLDVGIKPFRQLDQDAFVRAVCDSAAVYQVDPEAATPQAVRVSVAGHMVFPTGMVAADDRLVICDPGQPEAPGVTPIWPRLRPYRFDVVVHFLESGLPIDQEERAATESQVLAIVSSVVEDNRPAHTEWGRITAN